MFKVLNGKTPPYLSELFSAIGENIPYGLRGRKVNLTLPLPRTDYGKKNFMYNGAKLWNGLPDHLKRTPNTKAVQKGSVIFLSLAIHVAFPLVMYILRHFTILQCDLTSYP